MRFLFEDQVLDVSRRELSRAGKPVAMEPQVFDLLLYLVRERSRVVSKDDVLEAVWAGRAVSESALTTRINAVRRAVGDDGEAQRLIRTLPRKGFRFVGEVREQEAATSDPAASALPALPDRPSIAVLPFQNLGGDAGQDYFAEGMAEDIITGLSRFRSLFVIARNSSFSFAGQAVDVRRVGRELGVRYVLEGSVRRVAAKVRFTAQLIDAVSGGHVWADKYDGTIEDLFDLQDRITEAVVGVLEPTIEQAEIERMRRKRPENMGAYDYYLQSLAHTNGFTPQSLDACLAAARQAIALDPTFAPAYTFAARSHIQRYIQGWTDDEARTAADGLDYIERGLRVARSDALLLATAGHCFAMFAHDLPKGLAYTDESIAANPNLFHAYLHSGWVRIRSGDPKTARDHLEKALRLSPRDLRGYSIFQSLALTFLLDGDPESAHAWAGRAVRHNPNYMSGWYAYAASAAATGRSAEARQATARLLEIDPRFTIRRWASRPPLPDAARFEPIVRAMRQAGIPD